MKVKNIIPTLKKGQLYEVSGSDKFGLSFDCGMFERLEKDYWMGRKYMTDDRYVMKKYGDMKVKSVKRGKYLTIEVEEW